FRLDTGAHVCEVSADWARASSVPFGGPRLSVAVTSGAGSGSVTGWISPLSVRLPGWGATEFQWPCFFREGRPGNLPRQLGMAGTLKAPRSARAGTPAPGAPHGVLLIEERVGVGSPGP